MKELARQAGRFGLIRVLERRSDGARLYCIEKSLQTMIQADGVSLFGYVHAAKLLLRGARAILLIGGAGGSLATMLARRGHRVTVIDLDPHAEQLARTYFNLDPRVRWINADALHFLSSRTPMFDAMFVDACNSEGLVSAFAEPDQIVAMMANIRPRGSLILNLVHEDGAPPWGGGVATELAQRGLHTTLFSAEDGWEGNELLRVSRHRQKTGLDLSDIHQRPAEARTYLLSLRASTAPA